MRIFVSLGFAVLLAIAAPASGADPEYDGHCAMSVAEGTPISTDCAVVWLSPEGKIYCFFNQAAKEKFLLAPKENLQRAQAFWDNPAVLKQIRRQQ
jgi:YHS domain-containing protein